MKKSIITFSLLLSAATHASHFNTKNHHHSNQHRHPHHCGSSHFVHQKNERDAEQARTKNNTSPQSITQCPGSPRKMTSKAPQALAQQVISKK